ncbi:30S ribosomal protein S12 methylthiotransferase RimO [Hydrogenoanaerobacterium saccharovorans]|uniref:Ribosomal protein uS12 methylthiotransferase RimO n=1 Tax=Hydrogenoanaerobacterium saccharovorans TaxID=474960 RepID=A0ABS2GKR2_9FIRM|nr:30S ribosomal protein S12 methylthiotransferase RimO [Hydrogenoanaerobacterium saccharovorans]MBM6923067.1 30S ribosomal protein S12 methylthiotransferase RimO [Hydrogenoanaerobacterium saccharovorans]MBS5634039.1 30S ribosomal protein S12 methylthiotransferase RimO [Clostridiales bacterium]
MAVKVGMVSLGCSKNQVDGEIMLSLIQRDGYELCGDAEQCDVVIINTCAFIEDAKRESIENILEFCELKRQGVIKAVVVTGCLAERYQQELVTEIPEADVILGIGRNTDIVNAIDQALQGERVVEFAPKDELVMDAERVLTNAPYYAYIKLADGCDNRCTYCAIPNIRGRFRSRKMENILEEVRRFAAQGVTEMNLVAQDTTRYGEDIYGKLMLPELIREVCKVDGVHWVRILYCYPQRVTDELLEVMASEPKVVKYMDVPVQHASGRILKAMNRRDDYDYLRNLMQKIREKIPGVVLRTTFITGFPGETEEDFAEMTRLVKEVKFERVGCFTYSPEDGTPAYSMPEQIDEETKRRRADIVMSEQLAIAEEFARSWIGRELEVVVEGLNEETGIYYGRSYMDAPDIDTRVYFDSPYEHETGEYVMVTVTGSQGYDLVAEEAE